MATATFLLNLLMCQLQAGCMYSTSRRLAGCGLALVFILGMSLTVLSFFGEWLYFLQQFLKDSDPFLWHVLD